MDLRQTLDFGSLEAWTASSVPAPGAPRPSHPSLAPLHLFPGAWRRSGQISESSIFIG